MRRLAAALGLMLAVTSCTGPASPACVVPSLCARACDAAAAGSLPTGTGWLADACNCAVDCDLGMCGGTPVCAP